MELKRQILLSGLVCGLSIYMHSSCLTDSLATDSVMFSELKEVTVVADRPVAILMADRVSYNPSVMISGGLGNIYDAIQSLPGVSITSDGDIKINGIQSLIVNIDGRKTILNGENLINYLKTIPVTDIEKIEIESYSGAKSEGADAPTILNLVRHRKKEDSYALGSNIDGQSWKARQIYGSVFGEYCRNGHGVSVNYSHYAARNPSELLTDRPYLDLKERLKQVYDRGRRDRSHHISVNYEYRPTSGHTVGTSLNYNNFKRQETAVMATTIPFVPDPAVTSNNAMFVTDNIFGELYVKRQSKDKACYWTAAGDFFRYNSLECQLMEDNSDMSVKGDMTGITYGVVGSFDFNKSISQHWRISGGARCSFVYMNSNGRYIGEVSSETEAISEDVDNLGSSFGYSENVNAIFAEGKCDYGILNASIGLRGEQSNLNTYFSGNESSGKRNITGRYFHIYPSLSVMLSSYGLGSWMLAYANKVTRPRFADLDPFIHLFDDITHVGGNINLKEANRHSLSVGWSDNRYLRVMADAQLISGDIVKYYRELSDRIVYVTPENIPLHLQIILSAACGNIRLAQWWTMSASGSILYSSYRFAEDTGLDPNRLCTPMIDLKNAFTLPYQVKAEMNASFRGRMAFGQARISEVWNTYVGIRKDFWDGRVSLALYIKDIFNSNHFKSTILLAGRKASLYEKEYEDMRKIGISVSYRLSGGVGNSKKEGQNAWIDELNRVNL